LAIKKPKKRKYITIGIIIAVIIGLIVWNAVSPKAVSYTEETAKTQDLVTYYSFTGNIEAKDSQKVIATTNSKISKIYVEEGDQVKDGDSLFKTSAGQTIKAEIDGEVTDVLVDKDSTVAAGTQLAKITNFDNLQVTIKVDEYDIGSVTVGKEVSIYVNALDKEFKGTVSKISKEATTSSGVSYFTAVVDIEKNDELLVGMSAEIKMVSQSVQAATTISMKALQFDNENTPYVYVKEDGKIVAKEVTVGINDGTTVQILDGINSGDTVYLPKATSSSMTFRRTSSN